MRYKKTFPICPYKCKGNTKCSHKGCPKHCAYVKHPEKCDLYKEWVILKELDDSTLKYEPTPLKNAVWVSSEGTNE